MICQSILEAQWGEGEMTEKLAGSWEGADYSGWPERWEERKEGKINQIQREGQKNFEVKIFFEEI